MLPLIITIIILLILAGIVLAMVMGDNGIIAKAGTAKDKTNESQTSEENRLADYENKIDTLGRAGGNYKETLLVEGPITSGTVTFKDNHTIDEFDSIEFLYAVPSNGSYTGYQTAEYRTRYWNHIMNNHDNTHWVVGLYGYASRTLDINNLTKTGFTLTYSGEHTLISVIGINY